MPINTGKGGKIDKKPLTDDFLDDETSSDDEYTRQDNVKLTGGAAGVRVSAPSVRRQRSIFTYFAILLTLFILVVCILGSFYIYSRSHGKPKPYKEKCLMHYHEWKSGVSGGSMNKPYTLQGEFYQQVEIDYDGGAYEQLNVPSLLGAMPAKIIHEFHKKLTAIVDHDHGRCFILPLNTTLVIPMYDFYKLVKNIKAGYDSPNAQVVREHYRLLMPQIKDVSQFGPRVYSPCRFYETYHLHRADEPLALTKRSACRFAGNQYCLGCAGSEFMSIITIDECVG